MGENTLKNSCIVEDILDKRIVDGKVQYLIKWMGFSSEHYSWINEDECTPEELTDNYFRLNVTESLLSKFLSKLNQLNQERDTSVSKNSFLEEYNDIVEVEEYYERFYAHYHQDDKEDDGRPEIIVLSINK